jgi:hypothetical protein
MDTGEFLGSVRHSSDMKRHWAVSRYQWSPKDANDPRLPTGRRIQSWLCASWSTPEEAMPLLIMGLPGSGLKTVVDVMLHSILGDERWYHTVPVTVDHQVVGFGSGVHTELDLSAFATVQEWRTCVSQLDRTALFSSRPRTRRTIVLYRAHAASFLVEIMHTVRHWMRNSWIVMVCHRTSHTVVCNQFEQLFIPSPTEDEIRSHWVHVAATDSSEWARSLCAYWHTHVPPRDWVGMYDSSWQWLAKLSKKTWLSSVRSEWVPRLGVAAALASVQHQFPLRCKEQTTLWAQWDVIWRTWQHAAAGQRVWMLQLLVHIAMVQHEPPFTRQYAW